jgi:hypothetical protein
MNQISTDRETQSSPASGAVGPLSHTRPAGTQNTEFEAAPPSAKPGSTKLLWAGRIVSALPILLLLMSAGMKLSAAPEMVEKMTNLYLYRESSLASIGVLELVCTLIFLVPRTATFGAILLTGYLGGAVATHVRVGEPFVVPVVLGVLVWLGVWLRDERLRTVLPLRIARA